MKESEIPEKQILLPKTGDPDTYLLGINPNQLDFLSIRELLISLAWEMAKMEYIQRNNQHQI